MRSSWFYRAASLNNDVRAITSGKPEKIAARAVRKPVWRYATRALKKALS